jgi:hypothetical protein
MHGNNQAPPKINKVRSIVSASNFAKVAIYGHVENLRNPVLASGISLFCKPLRIKRTTSSGGYSGSGCVSLHVRDVVATKQKSKIMCMYTATKSSPLASEKHIS